MRSKTIMLLLLVFSAVTFAQEIVKGTVYERNEEGKLLPLVGVNIIWHGTKFGTTTNLDGQFTIAKHKESIHLIISMTGYKTDTLLVTNQTNVEVVLKTEATKMNEVEVVEKTKTTFSDFLAVENKGIMTDKELYKAACCNLSESFETNPSIDVSFTDAITGAKQIEMLGLSGVYTQTTMENLPFVRGLMSNVGLSFIPGTWVQSINVSKGIGSVVNGYESITGQIDVDLKKPKSVEAEKLFVNLYGDYDQRIEGNLNYRTALSDKLSVINLFHASSRKHGFDSNNDKFIDMPMFTTYNAMQRWHFSSGTGWESQLGFQYLSDEKDGGTNSHIAVDPAVHQHNDPNYSYTTKNNQLNIYGKLGYLFPDDGYKSFGIQWSLNNYRNSSLFGAKNYDGNEKTGYFNFIYQSIIGSRNHKFRTGFSFVYDQFDETFLNNRYQRTEKTPGAFFEYTYTQDETFSFILGLRADQHNYFGTMITPRFHLRYAPSEDWVIRMVTGRGFRTSNIFTEYSSVFASSRNVGINPSESFGYGLGQEKAWNYGINLTHYFNFDYREGTVSVDFYRTEFEQATIADLDSNPQSVNFYTAANGSYSNSMQIELNFQPLERLDTRIAYRYMDVKQKINSEMEEKPLSSKHRALLNFAYTTEKENKDDSQMSYDFTVQWFGEKRIPSTSSNPAGLQARDYSPSFALVNVQVTRTFYAGFDLYLGVENVFGFKQNDPILDYTNPNGKYFDASLIWGPVNGQMAYAGLRYKM
jgi:outer membrane receptor for ferrienterochelin and colicins